MNETTTSETAFQKQILTKLNTMERSINHILEYIEDSKLTEDEKKLLDEALEEHKKGNLLSSKEVFG